MTSATGEGRYRAEGDDVYDVGDRADQHGSFARWCWDAGSGRLDVETDPLGFRPMFYWAGEQAFVVATDLLECAAQVEGLELDHDAIAVFLRCGYLIGDTTPFRGLKAVPPGGLVWEAGSLSLRTRPGPPSQRSISAPAAIDAYAELFRTAVRRRLPDAGERYVLPLSGGRDSRHILLELVAAGAAPSAIVTVAKHRSHDPDVAIARLLAERCGVRHVALQPVVPTRARERRKNSLTNLGSDEGVWYSPVVEHLRSTTRSTYDGIGGDVLSAGLFMDRPLLDLFDAHRFDEIADRLLRYGEPMLRSVITDDTLRTADRDRARAAMSAEVRRHVGAPNPIGSFYFWNRTAREIAQGTYGWLRSIDVQTPFLDADLVAFLMSLPAGLLLTKEFHTETISHAHPDMDDVPYEEAVTARATVRDRVRHAVPTRVAALAGAARMPAHRAKLVRHLARRRSAVTLPFALACWEEQVRQVA
jgi:hypothetical protein